jgi:hypothetical protein
MVSRQIKNKLDKERMKESEERKKERKWKKTFSFPLLLWEKIETV